MVWNGTAYDEAGPQAGLTVRTMRLALERPHVLAYLRAQKEVLRESASAKNIHRLVAVRDQDENKMAIVQAVKALEQLGEDAPGAGARSANPGIVIVIAPQGAGLTTHYPPNGPKPLIEHEDVPGE